MKTNDPNIAKVELIAAALGPLCAQLVLVGGCAAGLLLTDSAAAPARVTYDVDLLTGVAALADYYGLEKQIAARGFKRDIADGAPICRWRLGALEVDLMPSESTILGFSNRWYPLAIQTSQTVTLPSGIDIRLIAAPAFMATKMVAFQDRGGGDYLASHDLEDVINLIAGRPELMEEIRQSPAELRAFLATECRLLLDTPAFCDGVQGFIAPDTFHAAQVAKVMARLEQISTGKKTRF